MSCFNSFMKLGGHKTLLMFFATPNKFQKYTTAVSLYDLIKKEIPEEEWINLQFNIQNDGQNTRLSFQTNNKLKCGINCMSNRFKSITNEIDKQWVDLTRDVYKTKCKKRLITEKLILLWNRSWEKCCFLFIFLF